MKQYLFPQPTEENPHIDRDYPTGFVLRCQRRTWREFRRGYGFRIMRQTSNPRADGGQNLDTPSRWCTPHKSTYHLIVMFYIDSETGYIEQDIIGTYPGEKEIEKCREILAACGDNISDSDRANLTGLIAAYERYQANKPEWVITPSEPMQVV